VCFETGLMGDPMLDQFGDRDTFAHLFCDWYLMNRPDTCWVVDDGDGEVVGYLIASPDRPDESAHQRQVLTRHLLGRGVILRPSTMGFFVRAVTDLTTDRGALTSPVDPEEYPAEMHINLLPDLRGHRLGSQLMDALMDALRIRSVPGVQLSAFGENLDAIAFFESQGFEAVGELVPNPGFRLSDGSRGTVRRMCAKVA
jgi:ribosomal protein S18 acetylase RimI-like enzyme